MRSCWIRVGLNQMTTVFLRRENRDAETHREEGHVKMEAETALMHLQAKEHQGSPATTRS